MAKADMKAMLRKRMEATQQASELQIGDEAYTQIFQPSKLNSQSSICDLPLDKLVPFFTADIGFRPYSKEKLEAFSQQIKEEGIYERVIVRPIPGQDTYELIAGHNRSSAARLAGWKTVPCEIIDADDTRATSIAIATNLLRRQELSIMERGKAYKALLEAERKQGYRSDLHTSGEFRPKFSARALVAAFFGVTEYEIRKAVKLTNLIPALQDIVENEPKRLNLACADIVADYDVQAQTAFLEMCSSESSTLNMAMVKHIAWVCPPPTADRQALFAAYREARAQQEEKRLAPPPKITFDRKRFAPYLERFKTDAELEQAFLQFLKAASAT